MVKNDIMSVLLMCCFKFEKAMQLRQNLMQSTTKATSAFATDCNYIRSMRFSYLWLKCLLKDVSRGSKAYSCKNVLDM